MTLKEMQIPTFREKSADTIYFKLMQIVLFKRFNEVILVYDWYYSIYATFNGLTSAINLRKLY